MGALDIWQVELGSPVVATLPDPGVQARMGARIEVPGTRAIASYWQAASLLAGGDYEVSLESPAAPGAYEFVWRTDEWDPPEFEAFFPLIVVGAAAAQAVDDSPPVDAEAVRPSVDQVAALERTRTRADDAEGTDVGTFDDTTYPTASDVESLIDRARDDVLSQLPEQFPTDFYGQVKSAIALYTAILIEGSFFRVTDQTTANFWAGRFDRAMGELKAGIERDMRRASGQVLY